VLLDTLVAGVDGGSGRAFAWERVLAMPAWAPVVVAGGLTPVNVGSAIRALRPFAVDVSSGVEERMRHKDRMKLNAFVAAVRAADGEDRR
jgi:phosphoribosylanthranilate isomerase